MATVNTNSTNIIRLGTKSVAKKPSESPTIQTNNAAFYVGGPRSTASIKVPIEDEKYRAVLDHMTKLHRNHRRIDADTEYANQGNPPVQARKGIKISNINFGKENGKLKEQIKAELAKLSPTERSKLWMRLREKGLVTKTPSYGVSPNFVKDMFSVFFDSTLETKPANTPAR